MHYQALQQILHNVISIQDNVHKSIHFTTIFWKNVNVLQNEKWYSYASLTSSSDPNKSTSSSSAAASPTIAAGTLFSPGNVLRSSPKEFI